jgi:hypothetical protein
MIRDLVELSTYDYLRACAITRADSITRESETSVRVESVGRGGYWGRVARLELARREALS